MPNDVKGGIENRAAQRALFSTRLEQMARKVAEDEPTLGVEFPHVTAPDGSWIRLPASLSAGYSGSSWGHGNWLCGFWVGLLLASYRTTGDMKYLMWARERMRLVAQRAEDPNTHDIGFIFDSSAIPGFEITSDRWYGDIALAAAPVGRRPASSATRWSNTKHSPRKCAPPHCSK